ncbi:response regulator [Polaribacter filamentus]|uniref:Response regulator n=1 Tax=Polaribacter filamentus TaxID=53483 RepID=A0A2S7KWB4_9FLAO|nr:response regulator [Polaribacter filamentus]PQB06828.1 response regulator [Polaribacter filamentus]
MAKKRPLIAIIDDDRVYHFILSSIINKNKLADSILSFMDGEEAIQYLTNNKTENEKIPDIVFLDMNMPIMDGWLFLEEYERIKKDITKKTVIFMISSSVDPLDIERAGNIIEITDYIVKPIKLSEVKKIFKKYEIFS